MEKRKLGKYGVEVSPIGIGAMSFSNFYGPTNEEESHKILAGALDQGISHIDTANVYGAGASEAASQGRSKTTETQSKRKAN